MKGHQEPGEQSQEIMKEMMRWMSKMMDTCTEMMSHVSQSTKDETSK